MVELADDMGQRIVVEIFGENYRFRTDNNPDYVRHLAEMVDQRMRDAAQNTRTFSGNKIGVLAALQLADEYCKLQKDYEEMITLFEKK